MNVKCGNHDGQAVYHASAAEVRACYVSTGVPAHFATPMAEQDTAESLHRLRTQHARNAAARPTVVAEVDRRHDIATAPQAKFLRSLLATRVIPASRAQWLARVEQELGNEDQEWGNDGDGDMGALTPRTLTKRAASEAISALKGYPVAPRQAAPATGSKATVLTQDGIYRNPANGEIFKVQWNRASGDGRALYAKRLVLSDDSRVIIENILELTPGQARGLAMDWEFVRGLIKNIRPEWRMTLAEAERFGALYGRCLRCNRILTAEASITRSMGPICAGRKNWA